MFVHARSYEDLTESEDGAASGESPKEGAGGPPPLATDMRQISQDFSELSTQLTGVARDLQVRCFQEALRTGQSAQGQPGDQPQSPQGMALAKGMRKRLPRPGAGTRSMSLC